MNKILTLKRLLPRLEDRTFSVIQNEDGAPICCAIERPWKDNQKEISCIPLGEYLIQRVHSNRFDCDLFQVLNVPNREAVEIHRGNFWEDSEGCIILGAGFGYVVNQHGAMELGVRDSGVALKYFMDSVMKDINEGKLIIEEA